MRIPNEYGCFTAKRRGSCRFFQFHHLARIGEVNNFLFFRQEPAALFLQGAEVDLIVNAVGRDVEAFHIPCFPVDSFPESRPVGGFLLHVLHG